MNMQRAESQCACFWARNLSLLVEKHEGCLDHFVDGNYLYMRLLQLLPLKRMGQNSIGGMQYSLERCSNINLLDRM